MARCRDIGPGYRPFDRLVSERFAPLRFERTPRLVYNTQRANHCSRRVSLPPAVSVMSGEESKMNDGWGSRPRTSTNARMQTKSNGSDLSSWRFMPGAHSFHWVFYKEGYCVETAVASQRYSAPWGYRLPHPALDGVGVDAKWGDRDYVRKHPGADRLQLVRHTHSAVLYDMGSYIRPAPRRLSWAPDPSRSPRQPRLRYVRP